ncbi:MAG: FecR domain-containing protein [Gammaproteobacteria bacterium]
MRALWVIAMITLTCVGAHAQTASKTTHTVGRGDSLYGIVAQYYPLRLARWTDVASDIVALNPDAFPQGLDSVMKLGDQLVMVDYGTPTQPPGSVTNVQTDTTVAPEPNDAVGIRDTSGTNAPAPSNGANQAEDSAAVERNKTAAEAKTLPSNDASQPDATQVDETTRRAIGRVTFSTSGIAINHNNQRRQLVINDLIYPGDAVTAGPYGSVTVDMLDEAEFRLQPSSRLMFERYQYDSETDRGSAVMTLVKGGFNARTGRLGKKQSDAVTVNTAVATVGVRGTEFALRVCAPDSCRVHENDRYLKAGLYTGVLEGSIVVSNNTGDRESRRGEFLHVAAPNTGPEAATDAAGILFSSAELALLDVTVEKEKPLSFLGWLGRKLFGD